MFRGNDPLRKKCCGNILRDHHHALTHTHPTRSNAAPTGMGGEIQQSRGAYGTCPVTYTSPRAGWFQRSSCVSHLNKTGVNMLFEAVTVKLYYFPTSCWIDWTEGQSSREGFGPEPKERGEESGLEMIRNRKDQQDWEPLWASHVKPSSQKQRRTSLTKDQSVGSARIWDVLRIAENRTSFLSGETWRHGNGVNVTCKNVTYNISWIQYSIVKTWLPDENIWGERGMSCLLSRRSFSQSLFCFFSLTVERLHQCLAL